MINRLKRFAIASILGLFFICPIYSFSFLRVDRNISLIRLFFAQTAEEYFQQGKSDLQNGSLMNAHNNFQSALNSDPNHQGANLFYAITRILMISNSTDFNTLLDRTGVSPSGRDIFNWTADFTRDPEGKILLPSDSPTGAELQTYLKNNILPEVNGALNNLSNVSSSYETIFNWKVETGSGVISPPNTLSDTTKIWEANELAGYKLSVSGTEYTILSNTWNTITVSSDWTVPPGTYDYQILEPIEIDYGDVLILKGSLTLAKAGIYILTAYNLDIDIDDIVSLYNNLTLDFQTHIINAYNQLLTLLPDQQLPQAKSIVREAINIFSSAIDFVKSEADPQENDLFIIDDSAKEQQCRDLLADLNNSLDGSTLIREIGYRVNLSEFFDNPKTIRNYLPTFIKQRFIEANTFPDPTFGGILPDMTLNELDERLWNDVLYPEALKWTSVTPPIAGLYWDLSAVHFTSSNDGWAVGRDVSNWKGVLLHYLNGTWVSVAPPTVSSKWVLLAVHFSSSNEGWAVGSDGANGKGVLLHYLNGSWIQVVPPVVSTNWYLLSVQFSSSNEGWAVGGDYLNKNGVLLHYLKGTWTLVTPPIVSSNWRLSSVHFSSSNEGWAVGSDGANGKGVLLHYLNGTWIPVAPPIVSANWDLSAVQFTSSNEGWAVGSDGANGKGVLLHYLNGTWIPVALPSKSPMALLGISFTSPNEGWVVGRGNTFLHYYNGSWTAIRLPDVSAGWQDLWFWWSSIHFTSVNEGWAVGADWLTGRGILLKFSSITGKNIFVSLDGVCNNYTPCFSSIQNGINAADSVTIMKITQKTYIEDVILNSPKQLMFQGGCDTTFTNCLSMTTINGSLTISDGKLIVENIILQ